MRNRRTATSSALLRRVSANLEQRCGVRRGDRLLVAVSGGADSVALLHLLRTAAPHLHLELHLAHFDHALRDESAADAAWVAELGRTLGMAVHTQRWAVPRPGEAAARAARYDFLRETARAFECSAIALAHHRDDQMETILLRLGRGTGLRGALGMAWRRAGEPALVRPLLDVPRDELRTFLSAGGASWREDPSNSERGPRRNRVRHDVLPALDAALGPGWHEHWNATWSDLRAVWTWIDTLGVELLQRAGLDATPGAGAKAGADAKSTGGATPRAKMPGRLRVEILRTAADPVLRAALQRWMDAAPEGASRAQLDGVVRLLHTGQSGSRIELAGGFEIALEQGHLARYAPDEPNAPDVRFGADMRYAPAPLQFEWREMDANTARSALALHAPGRSQGTRAHDEAYLAADHLVLPLQLRAAQVADRIQLLGSPGHRPVARVLQDLRVPRRSRPGWPVVEDSQGLVWMPGAGTAERGRIGPNTLSVLWLRVWSPSVGAAAGDFPPGLPEPPIGP